MTNTVEREKYLKEMEDRLDRVQADIKGLGQHLGQSPEVVRAEFEKTKRSLTEKREQVLEDIQRAKEKGVGAWAEMKAGLDEAWGELNDAADRARRKFSE